MTRLPYLLSHRPPIPAARVILRSPNGAAMIPGVLAFLDTAASGCVVPLALVRQLGVTPVRQAVVRGLGHAAASIDVYDVEIEIPGVVIATARAVGHPTEPTTLIGRDILNRLRVTFDGPNQVTEFQ